MEFGYYWFYASINFLNIINITMNGGAVEFPRGAPY